MLGSMTQSGILVSDFDGTMTERDFFSLVRGRWWTDADPDPWQDYLAGRLSHFDALNRFFARIDVDEQTLAAMLPAMEPDPALGRAVGRLQAAGWEVIVASAGCRWYIERIFAAAGVRVTIHANPGHLVPGRGLVMELSQGSSCFDPNTGIDKTGVLREALARHDRVAFAGDGPPDVGPALMVAPELRFARGFLADRLTQQHERFHPFQRWSEIADHLLVAI